MSKYYCYGEIAECSNLHGTPSGKCCAEADSFSEARKIVQRWLDTDHENLDHPASLAPRKTGDVVNDGDWSYWIEKGAK